MYNWLNHHQHHVVLSFLFKVNIYSNYSIDKVRISPKKSEFLKKVYRLFYNIKLNFLSLLEKVLNKNYAIDVWIIKNLKIIRLTKILYIQLCHKN